MTTKVTVSPDFLSPGSQPTFLPLPYPAIHIGLSGNWLADPDLMVYSTSDSIAGRSYTVASVAVDPSPEQLESVPGLVKTAVLAPDLQLPSTYRTQALKKVADSYTAGQTSEFGKVNALANWLSGGQFSYNLTVAPLNSAASLLNFLTKTKSGFCVQYAYAMTVLTRLLGFPARFVVGLMQCRRRRFPPRRRRPWSRTTARESTSMRSSRSALRVAARKLPGQPVPEDSRHFGGTASLAQILTSSSVMGKSLEARSASKGPGRNGPTGPPRSGALDARGGDPRRAVSPEQPGARACCLGGQQNPTTAKVRPRCEVRSPCRVLAMRTSVMCTVLLYELLTHLRMTGCRLGLQINFGSEFIAEGMTRLVNGLPE